MAEKKEPMAKAAPQQTAEKKEPKGILYPAEELAKAAHRFNTKERILHMQICSTPCLDSSSRMM